MISKAALSAHERLSDLRSTRRLGVLLDILVVLVPFVTVGGIGEWLGSDTSLGPIIVNLAYVLSIAIASLVLKSRGTAWRAIGLTRPASWRTTLLVGVSITVSTILAVLILQVVMRTLLALEVPPSDQSQYNPLLGNLPLLLIMLILSWTTIAFGEEMLFRAFLIDRLAGLFAPVKAKRVLAVMGSSVAFGLIHYDWGLAGIAETTLMGLFMGFAFLRTGRNLWVTIIAHGLLNTLKFILVFSGAL